MSTPWIIIDGYSLLHEQEAALSSDRDFSRARTKLIRELDRMHQQLAERITLVFDGRRHSREQVGKAAQLEVVFSSSGRTADAVIEEMIFSCQHPERILLVTSDRTEADTAAAAGCHTQSCRQFLNQLDSRGQEMDRVRKRANRRTPRARLGDVFPD